MVDKLVMGKAGEVFMENFEKLPVEEQEAIKEQLKQSQEKFRKWCENDLPEIQRSMERMLRPKLPEISLPEGESPVEILQEQNRILRKQLETSERTSEQTIALAKESNSRSWWANVGAGMAILTAIAGVVIAYWK
jgi:hypothetical protein